MFTARHFHGEAVMNRTSRTLANGVLLSLVVACELGLYPTPANARCNTNEAGCSGVTTFINRETSLVWCIAIDQIQEVSSFCLKPRETHRIPVRAGWRMCAINEWRTPTNDECADRWQGIWTD